MKKYIGILVLLVMATAVFGISPEEIIDELEKNMVHDTSYYEATMIVKDKFGTRKSTLTSYARGNEEQILEFTSRDEAGQKILRTEDEIYLYYPDSEEIIRLQGAALRDSIQGSDISYEDLTGDKDKTVEEKYDMKMLPNEMIDGHECYVIEMTAKERNVAYPKEIIWVDIEYMMYRQVHKFALSGKLLKEVNVLKLEKIDGKSIATRMILLDTMKKNSSTEFITNKIEFDLYIDPDVFSLEELSW